MTRPGSSSHRRALWTMAALFGVLSVVLSACSSASPAPGRTVTVTNSNSAAAPPASTASTPSPKPTKTGPPPKPVHVSLKFGDGAQVGVGMPIIAFLSRPITDAKAFSAATVVRVNGHSVPGRWYFERKYGDPGHPIEADYRLQHYWPGHANIHLNLPVKGLSAGKGLAFSDNLTLSFSTGAANILTVDDASHTVKVVSDGKPWGTFPTSLGASDTHTKRGIKVIMEKGASICMSGPGYNECGIQYTQRLTYDGEYLHAAPWNTYNIGHGIDSSNGCTNLYTADALKLYNFLEIGDVVNYPNANGPRMTLGDGYGDWNLSWGEWQTGGLYSTT